MVENRNKKRKREISVNGHISRFNFRPTLSRHCHHRLLISVSPVISQHEVKFGAVNVISRQTQSDSSYILFGLHSIDSFANFF